jgi:hypothetical protein
VRRERVIGATLAALAAWTPAALGGESTLTLRLAGGDLSADGPDAVALPGVRLAGQPVTVEASLGTFRVVDTRPGAPGWSLVAQAGRPTDAHGRGIGAPLVIVPDARPAADGTIAGPGGPLDVPRALLRADAGKGTGVFGITPWVRLTVPADAASALYTATIEVTVS